MGEEVINYEGYNNSTWLQNKKRGLSNRYYKYKRYLSWEIHIRRNNIQPDFSKISMDSMPVIINNFNRLALVKKQIEWLLSLDQKVSILIVDNDSTLPPLLEFYKSINAPNIQVIPLRFNSWRLGAAYIAKQLVSFKKVIITDSDLLPYSSTPKDIVQHLSNLLDKYPKANHIGLSLELNDIPDDSPMKAKVIKYESQFWEPNTSRINDEVYDAKIDTTFAMYRNSSTILDTGPALRTVRPYTLKHVDWYLRPKDYSDEYKYYLASCKGFATWATEMKRDKEKTISSK